MSFHHTEKLPPDVSIDQKTGKKIWSVGTLRYTQGGLLVLFGWLMFNDFFLMLMEQIKPSLTGILIRSHGATNTEIALYLGTFGSLFTFWINPLASTWSDRTRTRWGRRRPFLLICTPPMVIIMGLIPWMPDIWGWFSQLPFIAQYCTPGSARGAVAAIGFCYVVSGVFNNFILAIFTLFFIDVIPKSVMGRFNAILRIVTMLQQFIWHYWIFGLAEHNMKWIYGGLAGACAVCYMVSVLVVKEGRYPPPEPFTKKDGKWYERAIGPVGVYIKECYLNPYYAWVFAAFLVYQGCNVANTFRLLHWKETLGFSMDIIGKMEAWPKLGIALVGYFLGTLVDKFKSLRMMPIALGLWACVNVASFFFLRTPTTMLIFMGLMALCHFLFSISWGVMNVEIYPRAKMGQFCSAQTLSATVFVMLLNLVVGPFFDWVDNYQFAYAWSAVWQFAAVFLFIKVYRNWKKKIAEDTRLAAAGVPGLPSDMKS